MNLKSLFVVAFISPCVLAESSAVGDLDGLIEVSGLKPGLVVVLEPDDIARTAIASAPVLSDKAHEASDRLIRRSLVCASLPPSVVDAVEEDIDLSVTEDAES